MKTTSHDGNFKQVQLNDFNCSSKFESLPKTLTTATQNTIFHYRNPSYSCRCRRGYTLTSDVFNVWKLQETLEDNSRGDIFRSYRLIGGGF
jgi:hypothetical protein